MFTAAPIGPSETVTVWGSTILLTSDDIAGAKASEWCARGFVWIAIDEGIFLAGQVPDCEQDLTNFINHACDPNVWMSSKVTLTTRKNILSGDEYTIDYALFESDETWVSRFGCLCESSFCRGRLSRQDWRRPDLQSRYRGHFLPLINKRTRSVKSLNSSGNSI